MAPRLVFYLLKALSILSGKILSEKGFPRAPSCSFSVTKNSSDDVTAHARIYNEVSRGGQQRADRL